MNKFRSEFEANIEEAKAGGFLNDAAKLVLFGRISYAAERGEITLIDARELEEKIEPGLGRKYAAALQTASVGRPDSALRKSA